MKFIIYILINLLIIPICLSQETASKISFDIPSVNQEATSIWMTINDINFFEKMGYTVNLPKDKLIDSLILKSKRGTFGSNDFSLIYELLESKIYNMDDYKLALKKIQEQDQFIKNMIHQLDSLKKIYVWDFKLFTSYQVVLTLYGSGGSYDPDNGTITLFTTQDGDFKNYKNPANTIIHEIIHMGIEKSIVQAYNLSHVLKERIVDRFVFLLFGELLPDYKIQNMGVTKIDVHLKEKDDLKKLDLILEKLKN